MTTRKILREQLTQQFIPALQLRGFVGLNAISGNQIVHEFRRSTATGTHVLSIQFDKRQRPRFVINLYVEPPDGLDPLIRSGGTLLQGRVCPGRGIGTGAWFRADRPWWQRFFGITSTREHEAVSDAVAMLDEIEQWWQASQPSRHIGVLPIKYRKQSELDRNA